MAAPSRSSSGMPVSIGRALETFALKAVSHRRCRTDNAGEPAGYLVFSHPQSGTVLDPSKLRKRFIACHDPRLEQQFSRGLLPSSWQGRSIGGLGRVPTTAVPATGCGPARCLESEEARPVPALRPLTFFGSPADARRSWLETTPSSRTSFGSRIRVRALTVELSAKQHPDHRDEGVS
jgi:hypothetical protein